jgi:hypothetical protein
MAPRSAYQTGSRAMLPIARSKAGDQKRKDRGRTPIRCAAPALTKRCQAQLEPTALSVVDMLLPAVCTFWPWELACS